MRNERAQQTDNGRVGKRKEGVTKLLDTFQELLIKTDRVSVADYVRLAELEHEMGQGEETKQPKEFTVSWADYPDKRRPVR